VYLFGPFSVGGGNTARGALVLPASEAIGVRLMKAKTSESLIGWYPSILTPRWKNSVRLRARIVRSWQFTGLWIVSIGASKKVATRE
jgi:hypothetical protein